MAEISENANKEVNVQIEFFISEIKETGEYLRETDRKLSFLVQIYTGAFVVVSTLVVNNIIDPKSFLSSWSGIALIFIFILFTLWLLQYSLKCKETKQIYLSRMNFLRLKSLLLLDTANYKLVGYWASNDNKKRKAKKVGLDDLYPVVLQGISVLFGVLLVVIFSRISNIQFSLAFLVSKNFLYLVTMFILVPIIILLVADLLKKENEKDISSQDERYSTASSKLAQEYLVEKNKSKKY